ncbi:hypothetical protein FZEAL_1013 [Fusarium zealandicum]|uniref:Peptidase S53 domain-containing protein n=1 Tax=Fusarium zealandicum TaxID=1053134 RepID=A0A8H4XPV4_9HYPO|nr:hypothetical protein FZEAL_1013 [Fusarium zealandicum]
MRSLLVLFCTISTFINAELLRREHALDLNLWNLGDEADPSDLIHVGIALSIQNVDLGVETLLRLSDPASPAYGQYMSAKEVSRMFEPKPSAVFGALKWLEDSGIDQSYVSFSHGGSHLSLDLPIQQAAQLLQTTFYRQKHQDTGRERIACEHYHIPESLAESIDYVLAVSSIPTHHQSPRQQSVLNNEVTPPRPLPPGCFENTNVPCLRTLYGIPDYKEPHPNNSFGIFEPAWYSWRPEDLDKFFAAFNNSLVGERPIIDAINGGYLQRNLSQPVFYIEPNLDFQYAMVLAAPQKVTNVQVGSYKKQGNLDNMLAAFDRYYCDPVNPDDKRYPSLYPPGCDATGCDCGSSIPPKVLSISWGWTESQFTSNYLQRQCLEFLKLGLMGTTVVVSVSDHGTASDRGSFCIDDETGNATDGKFSPMFPSSCPWVTSVGGTQMLKADTRQTPTTTKNETAWRKNISGQLNTSGGGFSNVFTIPPYQVANVATYKSTEKDHLDTIRGRFNSTGRGYPDVAVRADSYWIVLNEGWQMVAGTSASTPVFASIITLINSERMHAGKGPVGFINPALYSNSEVLNDIVTGANEGCGVDPAFRAAQGWDAVTGLGSPDYEQMRRLFMSFP